MSLNERWRNKYMWIVAKCKPNENKFFIDNMKKLFGNEIKIYSPKVKYKKYIKNKIKIYKKFILSNYIFCYHKKFNQSNFVQNLSSTKGLEYFLNNSFENQKEILNFISFCKSNEDSLGYLTQSFFNLKKNSKAKFIDGPFANLMFEIIEEQKNKLRVIIGNFKTTISKKSNYICYSV